MSSILGVLGLIALAVGSVATRVKGVLGSSVFLSQPHFLNADEKFKNDVIGLNPNLEKHSSYISYEPVLKINMTSFIWLKKFKTFYL